MVSNPHYISILQSALHHPFLHYTIDLPIPITSFPANHLHYIIHLCITPLTYHYQQSPLHHSQLMEPLIALMTDSTVQVRDSAAWTIGRICEQVPLAVLNEQYLLKLLEALAIGLQGEPRVATNVCWVSPSAGVCLPAASICLSLSSFARLSVCLSVCLSVSLCLHLSPSVCQVFIVLSHTVPCRRSTPILSSHD